MKQQPTENATKWLHTKQSNEQKRFYLVAWKVTKETIHALNQKLEHEKWEDIHNEQNPQQAYSRFYDILYKAFDSSIPITNQSNNDYKASQVPWVTTGILAFRKVKKKKLYKKFIKNPTDTNKKNYKVYRNKFNKIKRIAQKCTTVIS